MTTKLAINGFGRIGRNIVRSLAERDENDIEIVAINDLAPVGQLAHLLTFDSVHGRFPVDVETDGDMIRFGPRKARVTALRDPAELPWSDVDIALECTGIFASRDKAALHLKNGSRKVLISAPAEGADKTIVYGVNHQSIHSTDEIISNASCTTNCLAPVAKVLHDAIGIRRGFMTTIHSYTGDQPVLDAIHKDPYRARAAANSMIPTSTGAARAVGLVLPELAGKLDGVAIRVPTPNVSVVDLTFEAERDSSADAINNAVRAAANAELEGILGFTESPNVSIDFNHDPRSSIFHIDQTKVMSGRFCRILSWYDNEWGFSNRMLDVARCMSGA